MKLLLKAIQTVLRSVIKVALLVAGIFTLGIGIGMLLRAGYLWAVICIICIGIFVSSVWLEYKQLKNRKERSLK